MCCVNNEPKRSWGSYINIKQDCKIKSITRTGDNRLYTKKV